MDKDYGAKRIYLRKEPIPDEVMISIARLVLAWAEIECVIDMYLASLSGLNESQLILVLGRQTISSKLALAEKLAKLKGKRAHKLHRKVFSVGGDSVPRSLKYRNVVSHAQYVGIDTGGKYSFCTNDIIDYTKGRADTEAHAFRAETLSEAALFSEAFSIALVQLLKLESLHEKSQPRFLGPHPKAPKQPRKKAKAPQPRPAPSQG